MIDYSFKSLTKTQMKERVNTKRKIMKNMIKVHYIHVWKCHVEAPYDHGQFNVCPEKILEGYSG